MKIALVLGVIAVVTNLFIVFYAKKKNRKANANGSSDHKNGSDTYSKGYLNTPEVKRLKQAAAAELGILVEELERMSVEDITQLAKEKELINTNLSGR
jgi:hypothetical protein